MTINLPNSEPGAEKQQLELIAAGDENAFAALYAQYTPRLKAYIYKFTKLNEDTEEILQETFLIIWMHRELLPSIQFVQAWIYKITARCCLQWLRKKTAEAQRLEGVVQLNARNLLPTPADELQWQELENQVEAAIAGLPEVKQKIYRLNREWGLKPSAIAIKLNMPVGTVKNYLSQAVKELRQFLVQHGYPLELIILLIFSFF